MATIDPARALPIYQKQYGDLHNQVLLRDIAIAELEERLDTMQQELAQLRTQIDTGNQSD